ncbi:MAG TPA: glycosyltransferase [Sphingomicrobium sp.]|nr:glycosyltransferase [Sphingomicrobium sp.]
MLIGIPSFRRPEGLRTLLRSLAKLEDVEGLAIEIFVADNDPRGREAAAVCDEEAPDLAWPVRSGIVAQPGISAARNRIIAEARSRSAEFVAMLDDDEIAQPGWLCALLAMQRRTSADAVGGLVRYEFASALPPSIAASGYLKTVPRPAGEVPILTAANNVLISCKSLQALDWPEFDHRFGASGGEDTEYFARLRRKRFRFAWAPDALTIEHVPLDRMNERAVLARAFRTGNNEVRIYLVNGWTGAIGVAIAKGAALILTAPLFAPILLIRSRRLWLLAKWASAVGRIAALLGRRTSYYGTS